jgi:metallophosphoesterase superfamily enzyme
MNRKPAAAASEYPLADGVVALAAGFAFLPQSRVLLVADAHFGYEDVMGGGAALPLWSTVEMTASIALAAARSAAREIVFLGDIIHGSLMSEGAIGVVAGALQELRAVAALTLVAGNHEGRSRGAAILGATVESCDRDGWLLAHGDKPGPLGKRSIIGHLHPSLHLSGSVSAPAFLGGEGVVVVPALSPYSRGLDVLSDECIAALAPWNVRRSDLHVVAATTERVFPFGTLSALCSALRTPAAHRSTPGFVHRRRLDPSPPSYSKPK